MDIFRGLYRSYRIYEVAYTEGQPSGEFRIEGVGPNFLSLAAAQRAIDDVLADIEHRPSSEQSSGFAP